MVVKRTSTVGMANLKRCRIDEIEGCEDDKGSCLAADKEHQRAAGYDACCQVPVNECEGYSSDFATSWSSGPSFCSADVETNSRALRGVNESDDGHVAQLLKSSRVRSRVLPSKFSDSLMHSWKKVKSVDKKLSLNGNAKEGGAVRGRKKLKREGLLSGVAHKRSRMGSESGFHLYNSVELLPQSMEAEDAEIGNIGCKDLYSSNSRLLSSSLSSVTSVDEGCSSSLVVGSPNYQQRAKNGFAEADPEVKDKANCSSAVGKLSKEKGKKEDFYKPDDFVLGDIVWAKCGKKYPAWPAVVIDPMWQAPEAVLRACVPGTICVMFYGYSKNGTQRVTDFNSCLFYFSSPYIIL